MSDQNNQNSVSSIDQGSFVNPVTNKFTKSPFIPLDKIKSAGLTGIAKYIPDFAKKFTRRKNHLLQTAFDKEFSRTRLERLFASTYSFDRSILPVLGDKTLLHKAFVKLENFFTVDLILVGKNGERVSAFNGDKKTISSSNVVQTLNKVSALKAAGKRIFIVGHHEGYVGPYFVRSLLRGLGFDDLAANGNSIIGPRMLSNIVLKNITSNIGNQFLILPSQKTKKIAENDLAKALIQSSKTTQFLIKMPKTGLSLIEQMSHKTFMAKVVNSEDNAIQQLISHLNISERETLASYFDLIRKNNIFDELNRADYELFKQVMYEAFFLFPEGTRSQIDSDGNVIMRYVNPNYMKAYMKPGDVILPISLVGGSEAMKGIRLSFTTFGFSVGQPYEVTEKMLGNYQTEGLKVMQKIAALPNIKNVYFDKKLQAEKYTKNARSQRRK